jgi:DnaK suppressor protein
MMDADPGPLHLDPAQAAELRERLEQRRREVERAVRALGEPVPGDAANLQFGKRIGDGTAYAIERMTSAFQAKTLYETVKQLDGALRRLEEGTYGSCEECGALIQQERLMAVPWTGLCFRCASKRGSRR